jgi:hypothetical protein
MFFFLFLFFLFFFFFLPALTMRLASFTLQISHSSAPEVPPTGTGVLDLSIPSNISDVIGNVERRPALPPVNSLSLSPVPFPTKSLDFSINRILPAALWARGRLSL